MEPVISDPVKDHVTGIRKRTPTIIYVVISVLLAVSAAFPGVVTFDLQAIILLLRNVANLLDKVTF